MLRIFILLPVLVFTLSNARAQPGPSSDNLPDNVILMIADGYGPAYATMAREATGEPLAMDAVLVGTVSTAATDSRVTDSAAGATAYACGIKSYNGAIAVDTLKRPCRTVLEAAQERGMSTGLVATSRLTHATPASFASHVEERSMEEEIAEQMASSGVDVMLGGGARYFTTEEGGSDRAFIGDAAFADDRASLLGLQETPVIGLFSESHMAYEVDRDPDHEPSLTEMTEKALELLEDDEDGFFLMVEGSRIDHAGHANDAPGVLHDVLAFDAAVASVLEFAEQDGNTLVVITADHETGGLTLGRDGVYAWEPQRLLDAKASLEILAQRFEDIEIPPESVARSRVSALLAEGYGIEELTEDEETFLLDVLGDARGTSEEVRETALSAIREIVNRRAGIGWTTSGHTGVDVNLYAFGPGSEAFWHNHPNDEVGRLLFRALGE